MSQEVGQEVGQVEPPRPCLALITDRRRSALPLLEAVAAAVNAGVDVVQLRESDLSREQLLALARRLQAITAGRALLVINGDVEVALVVGADGVHLPERGAAVAEVRARSGGRLLVGRSVHSVEGARQAANEGADYVQVGAVFATASHPDRPPAGVALVREARAAVALPPGVRRTLLAGVRRTLLLAVGGITPENAGEVLAAGADGVAVIGAILGSERPGAVVRRFREVLAAHAAGD